MSHSDIVEMLALRRDSGRATLAPKKVAELIQLGARLAKSAGESDDVEGYVAAMKVLIKLAEVAERRRGRVGVAESRSRVTITHGEERIDIRGTDAGITGIVARIRDRIRTVGARSGTGETTGDVIEGVATTTAEDR